MPYGENTCVRQILGVSSRAAALEFKVNESTCIKKGVLNLKHISN